MRRFFVEKVPPKGECLVIKGAEAGHIHRVLRMAQGMRIHLMDAGGRRCEAVIESAGPREVHVRIVKALAPTPPSPVEIILCQALLKAGAMDFVIQKASELGVGQILPFSSERTVVRGDRERFAAKTRRWHEIAVNASKQSNRTTPPKVWPPCTLDELADQWRNQEGLKLVLWESETAQDLKGLLKGPGPPERVVGIVGPEGGFSAEEVARVLRSGFSSVSLGRRILRAETAALSLAVILQYEWGDLSGTT